MKNSTLWALCAITIGTFCAPLGRAELVTNGDFGTGDFTGWTASPSGPYTYTSVTNLAPATPGGYSAEIGAYYDGSIPANLITGSISQTLTTVVGQQYIISFLYGELNSNQSFGGDGSSCCYLDPTLITNSNDPSTNPWAQSNNLNVLFGGSSVLSESNFFTSANAGPNDTDGGKSIGDYFYLEGTAVVVATSTSTTLEFDANDYQQNVVLTDISVVEATPEPGTMGLLGSALVGLGLLARRRSLRRS